MRYWHITLHVAVVLLLAGVVYALADQQNNAGMTPYPIYGGIHTNEVDQPDTTSANANSGAWVAVNWGDNNPDVTTLNMSGHGVTGDFANDRITFPRAGIYYVEFHGNYFGSTGAVSVDWSLSHDACANIEGDTLIHTQDPNQNNRGVVTLIHYEDAVTVNMSYTVCVRSDTADAETITLEHGVFKALRLGT